MCDDCDDAKGSKHSWKLRKLMKLLDAMDEDDEDDEYMTNQAKQRSWKKKQSRQTLGCEKAVQQYGITNTVSPVTSPCIADLAHISQTCAVMSNLYIPYLNTSNCQQLVSPSANILMLTYQDNTVITLKQFQELFYSTDQFTFCPNASCYNVNRLKLNNYLVLTSAGYIQFSLYDQMMTAYCNANTVNPNDISPITKMNVMRELQMCQSLPLIKGSCDSLTLDQCYQALYTSKSMEHVDTTALMAQWAIDCSNEIHMCPKPKTNVMVNLQVILEIFSQSINTKLCLVLRFPTIIPDNIACSTPVGIYNLPPTIDADIQDVVQSVTGISNIGNTQLNIEDL